MNKSPRNKVNEQNANTRSKNFSEVSLGFDKETAINEASRCLQCKNAPCKKGCPVAVNIPEFIEAVTRADFDQAAQIIKQTNSLPSICGRVCPQEEQCEALCVRCKAGGAVAIGTLERFVGDYALARKAPIKKTTPKHKVAVIGSGPAGLTVAGELARYNVGVTIFEAFHKAGGVLVYGIPEFRLPKKLVQSEIDTLLAQGVHVERNTVVGKTILLEELLASYDAVFIGSGAGLPVFMNIPGEGANGVYSANEYLTRVNLMGAYKQSSDTPVQRGKNVVVVGAGNVAMDAVRTARRLGADNATIVYRRTQSEMPARVEEIHHAIEEGVKMQLLTAPIEVIAENGWVTGLKCIRMELGEADSSNRRSPVPIKGSEFVIDCDMVIPAIGTSPNPLLRESYPSIATTAKGTIIVDSNMATSVQRVYAGGDAVTGAATVILAMGAGRTASQSILRQLGLIK